MERGFAGQSYGRMHSAQHGSKPIGPPDTSSIAPPHPSSLPSGEASPRAFLAGVSKRWHLATLLSVGVLTLALALLGLKVSGDESVRFGTEADRIYIVDGLYEPETSVEQGTYRWTEPLAQLKLTGWGPGRIHVSISGTGAGDAPSEATLTIEGVPVETVPTVPGQPWTVQGWGLAGVRDPTVTLEGPRLIATGDSRSLGRLVKELGIFAPDARLRAWTNLALLGIGSLLLYLCVVLWSGRPGLALLLGVSVPAVYGPLVVYRDLWMQTVSWTLPLVLAVLLTVSLMLGRRQWPGAGKTGATLLACVALTAALFLVVQGYMNAFDSDRMYQMTAGLFEYGVPSRYPGHETWTKYGFGQPLIAVPFYGLGKLALLFGGVFDPLTRFTVSLTNLAVTAVTCWLLYSASRRFASPGVSLAVAATYLLGTMAFNYARTFFSEPAGAALLLAALLLIIPSQPGERLQRGRILLAGLCLGAMIWFKPAFAVYIPLPGLAVLWQAWQEPVLAQISARVRGALQAGLVFAVGPVTGLLVQFGYSYIRYGDISNGWLRTGYEKEPGFSTPLLEGLAGLMLSPGKSVFLYAPALLLAPVGLWFLFKGGGRAGRMTALLIVAESAIGFVFNATWWAWTGNFAWGPRLILPVLPLLIWPLAGLGDYISRKAQPGDRLRRHAWLRLALIGGWVALGVVGALVSIPGALVDFQVYYRLHGLLLAGDPGEAATIYDPSESPLLVEPGYLLNGMTAAIHRPTLADAGMPPTWDLMLPAVLVLVAAICLWLSLRLSRQRAR